MTMKLSQLLVIVLIAMSTVIGLRPAVVSAEGLTPFGEKQCSDFSSPKAFVKRAVLTCLKSRESRKCERAAENFFNECNYEGEYREISAKVHSDILMLIVLQGTPTLKSHGERKKL